MSAPPELPKKVCPECGQYPMALIDTITSRSSDDHKSDTWVHAYLYECDGCGTTPWIRLRTRHGEVLYD